MCMMILQVAPITFSRAHHHIHHSHRHYIQCKTYIIHSKCEGRVYAFITADNTAGQRTYYNKKNQTMALDFWMNLLYNEIKKET